MKLTDDSCRAIKKELEVLLREFYVAGAVNVTDIKPETNYFELDKTSFTLAVETCMFNIKEQDLKRVIDFFQSEKSACDNLRVSVNELISQARAEGNKEQLNNKIKNYTGMDDIFEYQPVAFRGRNYKQDKQNNAAIYINIDHQELQAPDGFFDHLVTHEYVHLNAHGSGFVDWQDDKAGRPFGMCQKLDEGVTELMARLITYRRKKRIMFADHLPKYEVSTRVADALLGEDGFAAVGKAYFKGDFETFNQQLDSYRGDVGSRDPDALLTALANVGANMEGVDKKYIAPLFDWGILAESGSKSWDRKDKKNKNLFEAWKASMKTAVINETYTDPVYRRVMPAQKGTFLTTLLGCLGKRN